MLRRDIDGILVWSYTNDHDFGPVLVLDHELGLKGFEVFIVSLDGEIKGNKFFLTFPEAIHDFTARLNDLHSQRSPFRTGEACL